MVHLKASFCQYNLRIQLRVIPVSKKKARNDRDLPMDVRIAITDSSNVALEMAYIDGIESYLDK